MRMGREMLEPLELGHIVRARLRREFDLDHVV